MYHHKHWRQGALASVALASLLICGGSPLRAGGAVSEPDSTVSKEDKQANGDGASLKLTRWGFSYLPAAYHNSEQGVGLGGTILRPFSTTSDGRARAEIQVKGRLTSKGQAKLETRFTLALGPKVLLRTKVAYENLARRFYGIGPDTPESDEEVYRPVNTLAYVEVLRTVMGDTRVGLRVEAEHQRLIESEPGGLLDTNVVTGARSSGIAGGGIVIDRDTRDRKYSPTSGSYYQAFSMIFFGNATEDRDFNVFNVDLRNYFSPGRGHVFATQVFLYGVEDGDAPFWRLAALGGRDHTRGYRRGRYLDRVLLSVQGEYRVPVFWRVGLVTFAGLGDVASKIGSLQLEHMRPTVGAGARFRVASPEGVRGRFDIAFGQSSVRLYLQLDEAF